jgi:hypothetical protein
MNLGDYTFGQTVSFLVQLGATLIGVLLAFELDKWRDDRADRNNRKQILSALKDELGANMTEMIPAIRKNLEEMTIPFAPLSFEIWDAIPNKIALVPEHSLAIIGDAYYNLRSLEKALDRFNDYAHGYFSASNEKVKTNVKNRIKSVRTVILGHIREPKNENDRTVILLIREAISQIDKEIKRLNYSLS